MLQVNLLSDNYFLTRMSPNRMYSCHMCPAAYKYATHLKRHLLIHSGRRFTCHICHKTYSRKDTLKAHMDISHPKAASREDDQDKPDTNPPVSQLEQI